MPERLRRPILLLISEDPSLRLWMRKHLEDPFFLIEATTSATALETVKNTPLDCIILDSRWEQSDPFSLCRAIRTSLPHLHTPILLITGKLKKAYREEALEAGVTDFISDQLDLDEIETRIAMGKRAAILRQKTAELSSTFQQSHASSSHRLQEKFLLPDQILKALSCAQKEQIPVTIFIVRPDGFQSAIPKEVLEALSLFLHRYLGPHDLLVPSTEGRILILLHNKRGTAARTLAEELKKGVASHRFSSREEIGPLTISLAMSSFDGSENRFNQMVSAAIKALHQAQAMKNHLIFLDPESL